MYLFSAKTLAFYPESEKEAYIKAGSLPDDVVSVSDAVRDEFNSTPPSWKKLGVIDGVPTWVSLGGEELAAKIEAHRQLLVNNANVFMNSKQWPGKAAIGRLKGNDLTQYNLWLDYLDALEAVDTSSTDDVNWPVTPEL